jgi:hypothetical protein
MKIRPFRISRRRFIEGGLTVGFLATYPLALSKEALAGRTGSRVVDLGTHVAVDGWVIPGPDAP